MKVCSSLRIRPSGDSGGKEFNIEVLHILDREISPHGYNLTLKAVDAGVPQRTYYKNVHVQGWGYSVLSCVSRQ